jgi:hypothetical protein
MVWQHAKHPGAHLVGREQCDVRFGARCFETPRHLSGIQEAA